MSCAESSRAGKLRKSPKSISRSDPRRTACQTPPKRAHLTQLRIEIYSKQTFSMGPKGIRMPYRGNVRGGVVGAGFYPPHRK
eukprot:764743-Hanusia_phi.AAC.2